MWMPSACLVSSLTENIKTLSRFLHMRRKGQTDLAAEPFAKPGEFPSSIRLMTYGFPRHPHSLYYVFDEFRKYNNIALNQVLVCGTVP